MIYPIYVYGSPVLRQPVEKIKEGEVTQQFINDVFETMHHAEGVGLAAPQIGKSISLFAVDLTMFADEDPSLATFRKVFINPDIYERSQDQELSEEGCLSLPGLHEDVWRPTSIRIRYRDPDWVEHDQEYGGYQARVIQHEYDHLESMMFVDHLSTIRKTLIKSKLNTMVKGGFNASYKTKQTK